MYFEAFSQRAPGNSNDRVSPMVVQQIELLVFLAEPCHHHHLHCENLIHS